MTRDSAYTSRSWLRIISYVLVGVFSLFVVMIAAGYFYLTSPGFKDTASGWLSDRSGRHIVLGGDVKITPGTYPRFMFNDVTVGNADWAKEKQMFQAEKVEFTLKLWPLLKLNIEMPELLLVKPHLNLERRNEDAANWDFTQNPDSEALEVAAPEERDELPVIGRLMIVDGKVQYRYPKQHIETTVRINTVHGESGDVIHVEGKGTLQKQPFTLALSGGSVLQLRDGDEPYPFDLNATVGGTKAVIKGTVMDPVAMEDFDVTLHLSGNNAADLFPITGIALPPTPAYDVSGKLSKATDYWQFNNFKGRLGESDLRGNLRWYTDRKVPYLKAEFVSNSLNMKDLAGFIGADEKPDDENRVIPDKPLDISRLMAMDADVVFTGEQIKTPDLLDHFSMNVALKDGTLQMKPLSFNLAKGDITANIIIEGKKQPPQISMDILFRKLSMESFFAPLAKQYGEKNVSAGLMGGRAVLKGTGKSLRDMLATADGTIGAGMEGGQLSRMMLELVGLDISKVAQLLVTGDKPVPIQCAIADFEASEGMLNTRTFLIDTDSTTVEGSGTINLETEAIDMRLVDHPKEASLLSARSPILLGGTLKSPSIGIDPAALAARGGVAAALGVLLTPVGALLAFLEPGLGEDSHCRAYIQSLNKRTKNAIPGNSTKQNLTTPKANTK